MEILTWLTMCTAKRGEAIIAAIVVLFLNRKRTEETNCVMNLLRITE
jgi:hypothetical protein